jgi:hypothetical protein
LTEGPVKVPLIAAVVAGAVVAAAVGVAELLAAEFPLAGVFDAPALFVVTGLAAAVALLVAEDDEADALAVVSAPAIGAPAMLIALVDPN